ncbi:hypothetical protein A1O3_03761 [Capronia epimyces CBS 606.96]|uniref:Uncharacterized protein n=1 Tax=Capronia epimyces CBS 606.96 TaxID=1182542 RepID=W9Y1X1_9EURO|nr:uncharacterized protein A1O3_03761 [Capronia epimyces CBS 606.96]EXJ86807.1 hypothetical protein A1O3_03761 [Capronia epimyces CBS 606.96]
MAPIPAPSPAQQNDQASASASTSQPTLAISPALLVGIVILAAFAVIIIIASVCRYCRSNKDGDGTRSASLEYEADQSGANVFNPNRPRSAAQNARMKEVRWINNMYAWERGRQARIEIGELKAPSMLTGRTGKTRTWDEWSSSGGDNTSPSGSASGEQSDVQPVEDHSGLEYFYNLDNPYVESSSPSRQRLDHLAPPTSARNSYQTTSSDYSSRRQSSVLLPHPIQHPRDMAPGSPSPLRHEYQYQYEASEPKHRLDHSELEVTHHPNHSESEPSPYQHHYSVSPHDSPEPEQMVAEPHAHAHEHVRRVQNPRITINDNDAEDITADLPSPPRSPVQALARPRPRAHQEENNNTFESVDLSGDCGRDREHKGIQDRIQRGHGLSSAATPISMPSRTGPGLDTTTTAGASFFPTTTELFPSFDPLPLSQPRGSVSVYSDDEDETFQHGRDGMNRDGMNHYGSHGMNQNESGGMNHYGSHGMNQNGSHGNDLVVDHHHDHNDGTQLAQRERAATGDGVRNLIQEWESLNGRFGREF